MISYFVSTWIKIEADDTSRNLTHAEWRSIKNIWKSRNYSIDKSFCLDDSFSGYSSIREAVIDTVSDLKGEIVFRIFWRINDDAYSMSEFFEISEESDMESIILNIEQSFSIFMPTVSSFFQDDIEDERDDNNLFYDKCPYCNVYLYPETKLICWLGTNTDGTFSFLSLNNGDFKIISVSPEHTLYLFPKRPDEATFFYYPYRNNLKAIWHFPVKPSFDSFIGLNHDGSFEMNTSHGFIIGDAEYLWIKKVMSNSHNVYDVLNRFHEFIQGNKR